LRLVGASGNWLSFGWVSDTLSTVERCFSGALAVL